MAPPLYFLNIYIYMKLEACVDSVKSARNAYEGGASRVEVCGNLIEGGTTPSIGLVKQVLHAVGSLLKVHVLIRPRGQDFLYEEDEIEMMMHDISYMKEIGVQ